MFKTYATLYYTPQDKFLRAHLNEDFGQYYLALFKYATWNCTYLWRPRHGFHVSVIHPAYHKVKSDLSTFNKKRVCINYDPTNIRRGGNRKGFIGYYLNIESSDLIAIRKSLNIFEKDMHITLFTDKHTKK